ncbi:MAG: sigma-54-dependent Fis family transcriptional regulator [Candidatus Rokubacteria bacterium]|nr:sigma-54-dependent Fis family transcriptional regulator [Candidatus Rokubacteria bacterium]
MKDRPSVLVVDDDPTTVEGLGSLLEEEGFRVSRAVSGEEAIRLLDEAPPDVVVTDVMMGAVSGMQVLDHTLAHHRETAVVVVTGYATVESAVEAMRKGAYDYITKPIDVERLCLVIRKALDTNRLLLENRRLRQELSERFSFGQLVGKSVAMQQLFERIERVASTDATVLITGESGTGKELIASAIHYNSLRRDAPLVRVSCATLPETLIESEIFGHERGAFTGATQRRRGRFEQADGGTLFLDEVGDLAPDIQMKLLRVLQERTFERVGGEATLVADVRLIAATNRDLEAMVGEGQFREDLFYRLNVVPIRVLPLRDRPEDIPPLVQRFLDDFRSLHHGPVEALSGRAIHALMAYPWPGNVRELRNCLESLVVLSRKPVIDVQDIPEHVRSGAGAAFVSVPVGTPLREAEKTLILKTLAWLGGNKSLTAERLGIGLKTLYRRLEEYGISGDEDS